MGWRDQRRVKSPPEVGQDAVARPQERADVEEQVGYEREHHLPRLAPHDNVEVAGYCGEEHEDNSKDALRIDNLQELRPEQGVYGPNVDREEQKAD